ncbi:MAG: hypothetical protein H7293_10705 [Candidatus Saccharibacteria bacterium]|nr:hypothetical protein [Rhodoferax sp.]
MENKNKNPNNATALKLSTNLTARMITAELGDSEAVWLRRLHNWRRPERTSPLPWQETEAARPVYLFDDVRTFIDTELKTRTASTQAGADADKTKATASPDADSSSAFVRVLWNAGNAQGAFSISPMTARALAAKLVQAATQADQIAEERLL